jgi:2-polyprenyl-6-methoxyphenol hydroxylase-like FAD-dependent oxidoreductase
MESVVQICNQLHELMEHQQGAKPSRAALREIFTAYQKERHPRVLAVFKYASLTTKIQAWDSWFLKFVAEWIFPYLPGNFISNRVAELVKAAPKINFLPSESFMGAKVAWEKE